MIDDTLFTTPPGEFRPVPMWFWNDEITEEEVRRQVRAFAEGGLGGFQIAARTGLTTPYLSQRWFDLVELAAREAERFGLQVWLADEYPYPSGAAGGELTLRHPEYRAWHMRVRSVTAVPGEHVACAAPGTVLLSAMAAPITGGKADWTGAVDLQVAVGITQPELVFTEPAFGYSKKRAFSYTPQPKLDWTAPNGADAWHIWLIAAAEVAPYKFFGHYVDLCNPAAVQEFLATTYQRYADRLAPDTWRRLTGFFLDESHPPSWSWSLPAAFRKRNGYDLIPRLPALWTDVGPETTAVRYAYWQTLTELFMESFHKPVAGWCREHGVELTLEVDSLRNVVQRYAPIGGNDPGHEKAGWTLDEVHAATRPRFRAHPRFAAALAAQVGQRRVLVECYHSIGWSITLQDMKALADRLAAQGADFFVFHAFFYSLSGLRKWDAPPSQFFQNPFWPQMPRFTAYLGRLCYALSRGRRASPIALVDPITSLWTHGSSASNGGIGQPDGIGQRIAGDWLYLQRELEAAQRPFDSIDPLLLTEGRVENGQLSVGTATYRVIVLPPMASLEDAAWDTLEAFAAAGGTVVACGLLPFEPLVSGSAVPERCAARFGVDMRQVRAAYLADDAENAQAAAPERPAAGSPNFVFLPTIGAVAEAGAADLLLAVLADLVPVALSIVPLSGPEGRRDLLVAQRQDGADTLYFIANAGNHEQVCAVTIDVEAGDSATTPVVERLDLEDGSRTALAASVSVSEHGKARLSLHLDFPRYGSHLLLTHKHGSASEASRPEAQEAANVEAPAPLTESTRKRSEAPPEVAVSLDGLWQCDLANDNAFRLDRFRFGIFPSSTPSHSAPPESEPDWPQIEPKPLINTLHDLSEAGKAWPLAVQVETPFGSTARLHLALPVTACYVATFDVATLPSHASLCLEAGTICGDYQLWFNGVPLPSEAFTARPRWDISNREVEVREILRMGMNTLTVCVNAAEQTNGLVDALYLLGDFGVQAIAERPPVITGGPRQVSWGAFPAAGLPYFAGVVHLRKTVSLPMQPNSGQIALRLPDELLMHAGSVALSVNGHDLGVRSWAPFRWLADAAILRSGENDVTIALYTPLASLLEGKYFNPVARDAVRVEREA